MKKRQVLLLFLFFFAMGKGFAQYNIQGVVTNASGETLDFASIFIKETDFASASNEKGRYEIQNVPSGLYVIKASFIGYESVEKIIEVSSDVIVDFELKGTLFNLEEIEIQATRARMENPVPYSTLEREDIEDVNLGQDVPYLLRWMPSVTVTSDAGAGIGYTGIRVRGSEASRTNVTINGVPLNDSESQTVFWVDLPDFLTNVESIQIQRGVGVSTNGTSAFGATVHLNTQSVRQNPFAILNGTLGSFNTNKASVHLGTGLMNNMYSVEGRYSIINSDGYIDRASSDLDSYYFSASRVTEGSSTRINVFSGGEVTYQAWNGLPHRLLDSLRTFNTAGIEKPGEPYDNEVDNYRQTHGQLIHNMQVGSKGALNLTAHITQGQGFFENYRANERNGDYGIGVDSIEQASRQDIIIQRWLDNLFYGVIGNFEYDGKYLTLIIGGAANQYNGKHFGDVIWRQQEVGEQKALRYYTNDARKREAHLFTRMNFNLGKIIYPFIDLQVRGVNYRYLGPDDNSNVLDITANNLFFNPKLGLSIIPIPQLKAYGFFGVANREPSRNEFTESTPSTRPKHETLYNLELGTEFNTKVLALSLNFFNMNYRNQLVPLGQLGDTGEPIRTNVGRSYRRGIEVEMISQLGKMVSLGYNGTISRNKIRSFTELVDVWDDLSQIMVEHNNTDIAYSPNQIHTVMLGIDLLKNVKAHDASVQANWKYVGSQFLDNTSDENAKLDAFSYLDVILNYKTSFWKLKGLSFTLQLNNVLNNLYVTNGWTYKFRNTIAGYDPSRDEPFPDRFYYANYGNGDYRMIGLYPQAPFNFLLGCRAEF